MGTNETTPGESPLPPLEMWAGPECSFVRVEDNFVDQFALSGHDTRLHDLDHFAALGVRTIRYPILWERMATGRIDWAWAEARLERLRVLGIRPIVGLVHHGSGPLPGGLLNPEFAPRLAEFAHEVASRFPWVDAYTPINEPCTTARFSGLYGLWYPHGRDAAAFARCLCHEVEATRLAMRAIRAVNPRAQLLQTEDIGKTHATPVLDYQADFENERRWLSFDLLGGRVTAGHPMAGYLCAAGITPEELENFVREPCPPDLIGMNHYLTSERFLDDRVHLYPPELHGGNGRHVYVDVSALRVRTEGAVGPEVLLRELWERYRIPIAVTEVQLACTRDEQLRWLLEVWDAAQRARAAGIDVRAVTAWALLGAHEWDSLLTQTTGRYENGAFDLRGPAPRPTALTRAIKTLAAGEQFAHPVLAGAGWWRRPDRLIYPAISAPRTGTGPWTQTIATEATGAPLLVIGGTGRLGRAVREACAGRALPVIAPGRGEADWTQPEEVRTLLERHRPWAVVNCAGYASIDAAERDEAACRAANTSLPTMLAEVCAQGGVKFVTFSSDQVFDGAADRPYVESDAPRPLNAYGRSQLEAERRIAALCSDALILRTSALFGLGDDDFVAHVLQELERGRGFVASNDCTVTPTFGPEFVQVALDLLIDDERGVWHLAHAGPVTWLEWARKIAALGGFALDSIRRGSPRELDWVAARPVYSALGSERGQLLGGWERSLEALVASRRTGRPELAA